MNFRVRADEALSLSIQREDDQKPLARRKRDSTKLDGQGFRTPQWIDEASATRLAAFLASVWEAEDQTGINDPIRMARGMAPRMTVAERRAVERCAMDVVAAAYTRERYDLTDVSKDAPWDYTAEGANGEEIHIEVKGTTASAENLAVTVTDGERRHAEEYSRAALVIVTGIALERGRSPRATGGEISVRLDPWDIEAGDWSPTVWRYEPALTGP